MAAGFFRKAAPLLYYVVRRKVKVQRKQMYFNHLSFRQWLKIVREKCPTAKYGLK